ncbi:MAG: phage holin family protein [Armatimonadetes bacterium]|nr:phage holin family protein [Armatimonadota bacterium]
MTRLLTYWVISAASIVLSAYVASALGLDVQVDLEHPLQLFLGVGLLGVANVTLGSVAKLVTLPLNCLTFGLAWIAVNAVLFWWVGQMGIGFYVGDWLSALVGSLLMGVALGVLRRFVDRNERKT